MKSSRSLDLRKAAALLALVAALAAPAPARPLDADAPGSLPAAPLPAPPPGQRPEEGLELPFSQGSLTLSVEGASDRATDGGESVRTGALSVRGSTTLTRHVTVDQDGARAWGLVGQVGARAFAADLPAIEGAGQFLRLSASLGAYYLAADRNLYWIRAGAFIAEQGALLGSPQLHPQAMALGTLRESDAVTLLYGLGYTYDFGRGLPLPFLGIQWRWAPAWRLSVLLPVVARVTWKASEDLAIGFGTAVAGEYYRYQALAPPGVQDVQALRIVRLRLGVSGRYAVSARTHLGLEAGVEGTSIDTGLSTQRAPGAYLQASFGFGTAPDFRSEALSLR